MEDREKISRGSSDRMEGIGRSVRRRKAEGLPETAAGRAVRYQIPGERKRRTSTVSDSSVVREASDRARRTGESMPGTGRIRGAAGPDRPGEDVLRGEKTRRYRDVFREGLVLQAWETEDRLQERCRLKEGEREILALRLHCSSYL